MDTFVVVKAVVLNARGELLFMRRPLHDANRPGQWDIPGGNVEPGEDLTAAIKRETQEETGLTLRKPKLVYATSEVRPHGSGTWLIFLEKIKDAQPRITISDEHDEFTWMSAQEARQKITYHLHLQILDYLTRNKIM